MVPLYVLGAPLAAAIAVTRAPEAQDCPDAQRFTAAVERILGRPLASAGTPAAIVAKVEFSRSAATYEASVRLSGAREGERVLRDEGATCEGLADAVAVTTALLVDPSEHTTPLAPAEAHPEQFGLSVSGRGGGAIGLVGAPTWLAGGAVEASIGALTTIELGARTTGAHAAELAEGAVRVRLWFLELGAFRSLTRGDLRLGPCADLMGGALTGQGEGYPSTSSASLAWFAAGAGVRADLGLGAGFRLGARALGVVPIRKQSFSIGYVGTAHESSAVGAIGELVLDVKIW